MFQIVHSTLSVTTKELLVSLRPAIMLNALLVTSLFIAHQLLPSSTALSPSVTYFLATAFVGALTYTSLFLFFPFSELQTEAERWKATLRLTGYFGTKGARTQG